MNAREAFLRELAERAGAPKRLGRSRSLYELGDGQAFVYVRYSRVHGGEAHPRTFYGLREQDLRELAGRLAFVALLWDGQTEPLLLPLDQFGDLFEEAGAADDGQVKAQVYLGDDAAELHVARAGRHAVEPYFGWTGLLDALADRREDTPDLAHEQVQTLLGAIGAARGHDVWIPPHDRGVMDWTLAPRFPFRAELPPALDPVLREVDVVWMARGGPAPVRLYEVEHSSAIYSGLLRFNDTHLTVGGGGPGYAIVARAERRSSFATQLRRPTFRASGLDRLCGFMTYAEVYRWRRRTLAPAGEERDR